MTQLAIIGAGLAGLAAARMLAQRRPDLAITIYEKSRGLGGRAAARRRAGFVFDHGAQYVKAPTPELARLLGDELPADQLHDIGLPVWTFDRAGAIALGDPAQNAGPKWTYRDGLNRLGKLLGAGLELRRELRLASLRRVAAGEHGAGPGASPRYDLLDSGGKTLGTADLVLLTPPAPQAAEIVAASDFDRGAKDALLAELARASYRRCISLALAYPRPIDRPFYALVNSDRAHPIAWLALEHAKAPERCPAGQSLLIAQMAARWSLDQWDTPVEQLERLVAPMLATLLDEELGAPLWADLQRWRYALPDSGADFTALNATASGLFFAGDYTGGIGRVQVAIESGWRAAKVIEQFLAT